jgi:hypothetical protein
VFKAGTFIKNCQFEKNKAYPLHHHSITTPSPLHRHFIAASSPLHRRFIAALSPQLLLICEVCALVAAQWSNAYPKGGFRAVVSAV